MTPEAFRQAVKDTWQLDVTDEQLQQFETYYQLLVEWNQKMNLTAITDKDEVYMKHFFDSLTLLHSHLTFDQPLHLVDVGAGAGFPSIPLKIMHPSLQVTIVDSLNKRITFLKTLIEQLGLSQVTVCHDRAEHFGQQAEYRETFDIVTARAVARLNVLSELCLPLIKEGGYFIALKGASGEEEVAESNKAMTLLGGALETDATFALPNGDPRHIVVMKKVAPTPKKYPRKPGTPNKQPL